MDMDYSKMTYEDVITALVELDVARYGGESERQASRRLHIANSKTLVLALNSLADRLGDSAPADLKAAALAALMSNPIPKNTMNELLDLHAVISTSLAELSDALRKYTLITMTNTEENMRQHELLDMHAVVSASLEELSDALKEYTFQTH